ncbi:DUF234 domain-containing protein [Gordonia oleivorans]|uniref:DUF234 domain-containing protein n=1 Tax=Gordonia oleivorans TaxID=3156618 RepID=UPI003CCCF46D
MTRFCRFSSSPSTISWGARWEDMVTRHVRRLAADGVIGPDIIAVGRWWNKTSSVEIDIAALSRRGRRVSGVRRGQVAQCHR